MAMLEFQQQDNRYNEQKDTLKTAGADIIMSEKYSEPRPHVLNLKN